MKSFSIVGRRYSAGSSRRFSPFFSDCFERRGLVYVGADYSNLDITDESYQYDLNGNRELVTNANGDLVVYSTGTNNELTSDGAFTYAYDAEGNRISKTNAAGTERELYVWDYRNRLSSVTKQEYNTTTQEWETVQIVEYAYDYNNVLIRKVLDADGDGISDSKTIFLPENYQTAIQLDDADLSDSTYETVSHRYLWTPQNQDKLLADIQVSPTGSETLWTLTDHLGTIRDIIQQTPTGLIQKAHVIYDAYGNILSCKDANGADISNPVLFGFTGKYFDADTQLQNNVNRWYDSTTGRWLSTDPIGFNGNDTNLYRYVGNMIIKHLDIYGFKDYAEGDFIPEINDDNGAGKFNSINATLDDYFMYGICLGLISGGYFTGYSDAANLLGHYLGRTGSNYTIDLDRFLREVPNAQKAYLKEVEEAINKAESIHESRCKIDKGKIDKDEFSISSRYTTEDYPDENTNWYYAIGGFSLYGKGKVQVCGDKYTMQYTLYFNDKYNWDNGKSVDIHGITITDEDMGRLHKTGFAQEFTVVGTTNLTITWTKGSRTSIIEKVDNPSSTSRSGIGRKGTGRTGTIR